MRNKKLFYEQEPEVADPNALYLNLRSEVVLAAKDL
mgnify:CR=1 FL=1